MTKARAAVSPPPPFARERQPGPRANRQTRDGVFRARAAAVAGLLSLAIVAAPRAAAQTEIWTATFTPADLGSGALGCDNSVGTAANACGTATVLSDDDFTHDSIDYSVSALFLRGGNLTLTLDTDITAATNGLTLVGGSTSLALADAVATARDRVWTSTGLSWTAGTAVSFKLTEPDPTPAAVSDVVVVPVPRTSNSLQVSWTAADNTGKPALTHYDVRYRDDVNWTTVRQEDELITSLIIDGLRATTYYFVEVRAVNADSSGAWSSTAEGVTRFPPKTIYANNPLIPDDLGAGDSFRLLFITEGAKVATGTGIHDYHAFASSSLFPLTQVGGLMYEWGSIGLGQRALVSLPGADARLITDTTWTNDDRGMPIYWFNGARVADDYADFYDGVWVDEANATNDLGQPHSLADPVPWTGTDHDGTELFDNIASRALGQATVGVGAPGSTASGAGPINGDAAFAKTEERPLYGLWHVLVVDENLRLISNSFQSGSTNSSDTRDAVRAQLFTTGRNTSGYGIARIEVQRGSETDAFLGTVALYTTDEDGDPDLVDGLHATLSLERTHAFYWDVTAPQGTVLKPRTTYALVFHGDGVTYPELWTLAPDGEDAPAEGWSLADALIYQSAGMWVENPNGKSLRMEMIGPALEPPVPEDWSLKPAGLAAGDTFRLLFLSSTKRNGSSSNIADYNTFVQDLAAAGHADIRAHSAGFRAVGCTEAVDARDNTGTTYTGGEKGVPIYWLNGTRAVDDYEDFYDGDWDDEVNDKNESGADGPDTSQNDNHPITGCDDDGTEALFNGDSRALGGTTSVRTGRPNSSASGDGPISGTTAIARSQMRPMYGLSAVFRVAADDPVSTDRKVVGDPRVLLDATLTVGTYDEGVAVHATTDHWGYIDAGATGFAAETAGTLAGAAFTYEGTEYTVKRLAVKGSAGSADSVVLDIEDGAGRDLASDARVGIEVRSGSGATVMIPWNLWNGGGPLQGRLRNAAKNAIGDWRQSAAGATLPVRLLDLGVQDVMSGHLAVGAEQRALSLGKHYGTYAGIGVVDVDSSTADLYLTGDGALRPVTSFRFQSVDYTVETLGIVSYDEALEVAHRYGLVLETVPGSPRALACVSPRRFIRLATGATTAFSAIASSTPGRRTGLSSPATSGTGIP